MKYLLCSISLQFSLAIFGQNQLSLGATARFVEPQYLGPTAQFEYFSNEKTSWTFYANYSPKTAVDYYKQTDFSDTERYTINDGTANTIYLAALYSHYFVEDQFSASIGPSYLIRRLDCIVNDSYFGGSDGFDYIFDSTYRYIGLTTNANYKIILSDQFLIGLTAGYEYHVGAPEDNSITTQALLSYRF